MNDNKTLNFNSSDKSSIHHSLFKSKEQITNWLNLYNIKHYTLIPDEIYGFIVNVQGSVFLAGKNLNCIPIKFHNVTGDFTLSNNNLTSLMGSPNIVQGHFNLCYNKLTSLEGGPQEVFGHFIVSNNNLTNLFHSPQIVKKSFMCDYNRLVDLVGITQNLHTLECANNSLASLKGAPKYIQGFLDCSNNQLTSLEFCPEIIEESFVADNNDIFDLRYFPSRISGEISLKNNPKLNYDHQRIFHFARLFQIHLKDALPLKEQQTLSKALPKSSAPSLNHNKI